MSKLLTIEELAAYAGCSVRHIHNEIARKNIRAMKTGKRLMFREDEVNKWLNRKAVS